MEGADAKLARLHAIMESLLRQQIAESLTRVEASLQAWRADESDEFEAHAQLLAHAARAERLAARMARVDLESAGALLRDAFDRDLLARADFVELTGKEPEAVEPSPSVDEDIEGEPERTLPPKRDVTDQLMAEGPILLHIDARRDGVNVPAIYQADAKLVLRFGYQLSPPIPDLVVDDEGVCGTLTFGGVPHRCILPWHAIYAVVSEVDHRGMVWPEDVPESVVSQLAGSRANSVDTARDGDDDGDDEPPSPGPGSTPRPRAKKKKRTGAPHLKLVK